MMNQLNCIKSVHLLCIKFKKSITLDFTFSGIKAEHGKINFIKFMTVTSIINLKTLNCRFELYPNKCIFQKRFVRTFWFTRESFMYIHRMFDGSRWKFCLRINHLRFFLYSFYFLFLLFSFIIICISIL